MSYPEKHTLTLIVLIFGVGFSGCTSPFSKNVMVNPQAKPAGNAVDNTNDWHESVAEAFANATATGKPLLVNFTGSDWCVYCQKLEAEVFETAQFQQWASQNVTLLKVDFPKRSQLPAQIASQNENLKRQYQGDIGGFPTILFLEPSGAVIGKAGYTKGGPENWIGTANNILFDR